MNSDCVAPVDADTAKMPVALVSPAEETLMLPVPAVLGVKLVTTLPFAGVSGEAGLKAPDTPLTEKATALVALVTVAPLAS